MVVDAFLEVLQTPEQFDTRIEKLNDDTCRLVITGWDDVIVCRFRMGKSLLYIFWLGWIRFEGEFTERLS
jgi:hypothetical protein